MEMTRQDYDGLGQRVTKLREDFVECKATRTEQITGLYRDCSGNTSDIRKLYEAMVLMGQKVSAINNRIIGGAAVLSLLIPLLTAIILRNLPGG
jgi:hypothetical protein